jgi:hypothetical protein
LRELSSLEYAVVAKLLQPRLVCARAERPSM